MTDDDISQEAVAYEERLLLYLDLLGWSKEIEKSASDPSALKTLWEVLRMLRLPLQTLTSAKEEKMVSSSWETAFFSDTLIASVVPERCQDVFKLVRVSISIASYFAAFGVYVRGAVTYGKLYHRGDVILGPALLRAYDIERNLAKYPRIIVEPAAGTIVEDAEKKFGNVMTRVDADGLRQVDVLSPSYVEDDIRQKIRMSVQQRLHEDRDNLNHYSKHCWMLSYLDRVEGESASG